MAAMDKQKAIDMLGGTVTKAAAAVGIVPQAVSMWPAILTPRISDRVHAAYARIQEAKKRKTRKESMRQVCAGPQSVR